MIEWVITKSVSRSLERAIDVSLTIAYVDTCAVGFFIGHGCGTVRSVAEYLYVLEFGSLDGYSV